MEYPTPVTLLAPCKINLSLGIRGLLPGGYHHMEMVMQAVSLGDRVTLSLTQGEGCTFTCTDPSLPTGEGNLAVRAAAAFWQALGRRRGCAIHLEKQVPSQAGLGGGSADGAAVLTGLNRLMGEPFSLPQLREIGLTVGADLPFTLTGGTALVTGVGEVERVLPPLPDCTILLAKPPQGVSTAACFAAYDRLPTPPAGDTAALLAALGKGDLAGAAGAMFNELRLAAALPEISRLEERLLALGALGACMSGSGSAVAAIFPPGDPSATAAAALLNGEGVWARLCTPFPGGPTPLEWI